MRIRRGIAALAASAALTGGIVATAMPAGAAPGDTSTTFAITAGALSITVPASANLGSAAAGAASLNGTLGNVTVTDQRGGLLPLWTATVTATDFTTGGGSADEKVVKANVSYASGARLLVRSRPLHPAARRHPRHPEDRRELGRRRREQLVDVEPDPDAHAARVAGRGHLLRRHINHSVP